MKKPTKKREILSALATWSGGKDSCYALYLSKKRGITIVGLINALARDRTISAFQGVPSGLVRLQARRIGFPIHHYQLSDPSSPAACVRDSARAIDRLRKRIRFNSLISGHNNPADPQREHMLSICRPRGLKLLEPHCGCDTKIELEDFIKAGFRAIIVKILNDRIDLRWLGRPLDKCFIDYLASRSAANFCGDDEYQSLVLDGPLFDHPIRIIRSEVVNDGPSRRLDIQAYR